MTVLGILSVSFFYAEFASIRASDAFAASRSREGGADSALATAINRIAKTPALGRDPSIFPTDGPCALNVPTSQGLVTTTCAATAGSGSGAPGAGGAWPSAPDATAMQSRIMTVLACTRGAGRDPATVTSACDAAAGDTLILRARVRFDVTTDGSGQQAANVPVILSWAREQ